MGRPTITDLAAEAGVSVATVDRVLNGRHRCARKPRSRFTRLRSGLAITGVNTIRNRVLSNRPELHFGVILQKERHAFYRSFANQIEATMNAATEHRMRATIRFCRKTMPRGSQPK